MKDSYYIMDTLININNLKMNFGGIQALTDINIAIPKNKITAIIGPNGAGKTTLFNCITGFYKPSHGHIFLNTNDTTINLNNLLGEDLKISDLITPNKLRENLTKIYYNWFGGAHLINRIGIARTFQNIRLFANMTVLENLLVAQHTQINKKIISGLLNLKKFQDSESKAIQKAVHWLEICNIKQLANAQAGSLAYGHQRLTEIARAMCTSPKLICLDEPAAGLNSTETQMLSCLIKKLCEKYNTTVVLIEHDMDLVMKISDQIYVLDHGSVIATGTPTEIRNNPAVISAYLGQ